MQSNTARGFKGERKATGYSFLNDLKLHKERKLQRIDRKKLYFTANQIEN